MRRCSHRHSLEQEQHRPHSGALPQNRSHAFWERKSNGGFIDRDIYVRPSARPSLRPPARINFVVGRRRTGGKAEEGTLELGLLSKKWDLLIHRSRGENQFFVRKIYSLSQLLHQVLPQLPTHMSRNGSNPSTDTHKMRQTTDEGAHASGKEGRRWSTTTCGRGDTCVVRLDEK